MKTGPTKDDLTKGWHSLADEAAKVGVTPIHFRKEYWPKYPARYRSMGYIWVTYMRAGIHASKLVWGKRIKDGAPAPKIRPRGRPRKDAK